MSNDTSSTTTHSTKTVHWPRSFLRRQGHATHAQKRAIREHWTRFGIDCIYNQHVDLNAAFGRSGARRCLDIGFGHGDTLIALSNAHPDADILGIEIHRPGIGAALQKIQAHDKDNIRIIRHDVFKVLLSHLPPQCIHKVCVFFPEPWPKDKDIKRRMIRPLFFELIEPLLITPATIHIATDVTAYAEHARTVLEKRPGWYENVSHTSIRPSWRPITYYEQKGMDAERIITDLCYTFA